MRHTTIKGRSMDDEALDVVATCTEYLVHGKLVDAEMTWDERGMGSGFVCIRGAAAIDPRAFQMSPWRLAVEGVAPMGAMLAEVESVYATGDVVLTFMLMEPWRAIDA